MMVWILLALAAVGHMVVWVALINRIHAVGIRRIWVDLLTLVFLAAIVFVPPAIGWALFNQPAKATLTERLAASPLSRIYAWSCAVVCVASAAHRLTHWQQNRRCEALISDRVSHIKLSKPIGKFIAPGRFRLLAGAPLNEVLRVRLQEKELAIPRLATGLDGLRIAHVSDLHFCGRIERSFFDAVLETTNDTCPDLVAITGDIVDGEQWVDWIAPAIGRLRAKYGVYYVLGNHDRRASEARLKAAMEQAGTIHVGGRCLRVDVDGVPLDIAGNELPWYKPAADFEACPSVDGGARSLRLLLAHSPDQFGWAVQNDVDLMLAGHLHGGQIRLPLLGAITSPSIHVVRYVGGVFRQGSTVMHVSRGVGSLTPVRFNCPPEIAVLTLRAIGS